MIYDQNISNIIFHSGMCVFNWINSLIKSGTKNDQIEMIEDVLDNLSKRCKLSVDNLSKRCKLSVDYHK